MTRRERGVYKRGSAYWIDYTDLRGQRHREPAGVNYRLAVVARRQRQADIQAGKFGLRHRGRAMTLRAFVDRHWRPEVAPPLAPETRRSYEANLRNHILPYFGTWPLATITRADLRAFVAHLRSVEKPLTPKTLKNVVGLLGALLEYATVDYELLAANPLRGMLARSRRLILDDRPKQKRILEPEQFRDAVDRLPVKVARMAIVASLAGGLRWGELIALRAEIIDYRRNVIHVTCQLQKRKVRAPKSRAGVRDVDMTPLVRKVLQATDHEGLIFSPDGVQPLNAGRWIKRQWKKAQVAAGITRPIRWQDLRHQCASLLIAAGKDPLYIAKQMGHRDPGFTLRQYGHLFETIKRTPVEWIDDLIWPTGCAASVTWTAATTRQNAGERVFVRTDKTRKM